METKAPIGLWERIEMRLLRRQELFRGQWWRWRGVCAGMRFGLGPGVRIFYPRCLTVGDDVTFEGPAYLHCLSERGVRIGSHTSFSPNLWLHCGGTPEKYGRGWFEIGEHSFVGCNAVLGAGGGIFIGNNVLIAPNVTLVSEEHVFADTKILIREQGVAYGTISISNNVWIGASVQILAGITIGEGAVIGAGAVVTRDIPSQSVAVGIPAKVIQVRS